MNLPTDVRYTSDHEWARADGDVVTMGITDFAQTELGDIVYVVLPSVGTTVAKGAAFAEVESTKSVSDVYAVCSGEVLEVNAVLEHAPEKINADPYGEGWIARIRASDPTELDHLLDSAAYETTLT